jgi:hypothetical protein
MDVIQEKIFKETHMGNTSKEELTCPFHEDQEGKICSINTKLDLIFNEVSNLKLYNAKVIGGLFVAQIGLTILLRHFKII